MGGFCRRINRVQNARAFSKNLPISKAQDTIAARVQKFRAVRVIYDITILTMLFAIEFDNQLGTMAGEVRDIRTDRSLSAKMQPAVFKFAQH